GDGCQVRDVLWVGDLVDAMQRAMENAERNPGEVFNLGGGRRNAGSVRTVVDRLMELTGIAVPVLMYDWRPGDQRIYVSDTTRALDQLGWRPTIPWDIGLGKLLDWIRSAPVPRGVLPFRSAERRPLTARAAS